MPASGVGNSEVIESFLAHLEIERRMSAHTLDAYRRDLDALTAWAGEQGIDGPATLHTEQLRAFVASEHRRGLSPKSLQRRLSACRSFYQWLLRHGSAASLWPGSPGNSNDPPAPGSGRRRPLDPSQGQQ